MAAYLIGHIRIKDPAQWNVYVEGVRKSLIPFEAQVIFRGKRASVLAGEHPYQDTVVIKFPDQSALQKWYRSESYQELIPIRDSAADVVIISYDA
ncbi:MAG: DUF1330 domain-containing protein [Desulfobacterales bacterium]|nr:MAG: DUF1330 domain-containing protein [Desulfobacterales bacterium]